MDAIVTRNPGLRGTVRTTLDLDLQATVERLVRSHLSALNRHDITQSAVVVVENATGAIRAMVGSENYAVSQINGATQPRSCGSTLKPFVYLEAIDKRLFTAASLLPDTPDAIRNEYADYDPQNYSHHYFGPVRLREALACSLNVPAVFVLSQLGARPTFYQLQKWGFNFPQGLDDYGAGFVLGNAETRLVDLAAAYAGLARGGTAMRAKFLASEHQPLTRIASAEATQSSPIFCAITTRVRKVSDCVQPLGLRTTRRGKDRNQQRFPGHVDCWLRQRTHRRRLGRQFRWTTNARHVCRAGGYTALGSDYAGIAQARSPARSADGR